MKFDAQLAGWRESHNGGFVASFWFADADEAREAFALMTERKGKTAGQLLTMTLTDAEEPCAIASNEPARAAKSEKVGGIHLLGPIARWLVLDAGKDPLFWKFLSCNNENECAIMIKEMMVIASRKEIDGDSVLTRRFNNFIRLPYQAWLKTQQEA